MKVLITGAAGFIGNHVTRLCIEQGDDVRAMVAPGEDQGPLNDLDLEITEGDLLDKKTIMRENLFQPDKVHNLLNGKEQGREQDYNKIWNLLMFQSWKEKHVNNV